MLPINARNLTFVQSFKRNQRTEHEAFSFERQIKGWSRAKKEALVRGDWGRVHLVVRQERKQREAKKRK